MMVPLNYQLIMYNLRRVRFCRRHCWYNKRSKSKARVRPHLVSKGTAAPTTQFNVQEIYQSLHSHYLLGFSVSVKTLWPCFTMILASLIKKFSVYSLLRSWRDLIKMYQEFLSYKDLGKIIHVLSKLSISCMSWQSVSSFISLELI